jgi:GNAT superfamily N-acetyltransferase
MNTPDINFVEVTTDFPPSQLEGFIHLYQLAYHEKPYEEEYAENPENKGNTISNVTQQVWEPHLLNGCITLALQGQKVVGLGCCLPMNIWAHDKEFQDFISSRADQLPDHIDKICFMSEVCVDSSLRHQGIGSELVLRRIAWAKARQNFSHYMMRTAAEGSNSKNMYLRLNAWVIPGLVQDVTSHAEEVLSASKARIFMAGKI